MDEITGADDGIVLFDEAIRFLETLTDNGSCFACGSQSWDVATDMGTDALVLEQSTLRHNGKSVYNIVLSCNKCGLERKHRAKVIREWLAANPAVAAEESSDE